MKTKKILIYIISALCVSCSTILPSNINVYAAVNTGQVTDIKENQSETTYNSDVRTATNNMLSGAGITNRNRAYNNLTITTKTGEEVTSDYIASHGNEPVSNYTTISYKSDSDSQGLKNNFGNNGVGLNNFYNKYGDLSPTDFSAQIQKLSDSRQAYMDYVNSIGANSSSSTQNGTASITDGVNLGLILKTVIENKEGKYTPEQMEEANKRYQEYLNNGGDPDNALSIQDIEFNIAKAGLDGKDAVVDIKPNTRTFRYVTKVRYTITDKNTGEPITFATPDNRKTQALFAEYNSVYYQRWMDNAKQAIPNIVSKGNGVYEMDFETPIKATSNPWKNILDTPGWQVTGADPSASDFAAVGDFTLEKSSRTLQVKIDVIGNTCTAKEKITDATYPTGKSDQAGVYSYFTYDKSFETGTYIVDFDEDDGDLNERTGKIPNRVMERERRKEDDETVYKTVTHRNMPFHSNRYNFTGSEDSELDSNDAYKTWSENNGKDVFFAKGIGYGSQIMDSTFDGEYCRDIKFKVAKVRHWDYRDDLLTGAEAYPSNGSSGTSGDGDIGAAVYRRYTLSDEKSYDLVTFKKDGLDQTQVQKNVVNGYCEVKETPVWRQPDVVREGIFATATWTLSPLEGEIEIPAKTKQGVMQGVINGANNEIGENKSINDITNNTKGN